MLLADLKQSLRIFKHCNFKLICLLMLFDNKWRSVCLISFKEQIFFFLLHIFFLNCSHRTLLFTVKQNHKVVLYLRRWLTHLKVLVYLLQITLRLTEYKIYREIFKKQRSFN